MKRRVSLALALALALAGFAGFAACAFPSVAILDAAPDEGGTDATVQDGTAEAGNGDADGSPPSDGGSVTIDATGPCVDGQKRCGVACTSIFDPGHGCGDPSPSCEPCPGPAHSQKTLCEFPDASCSFECQAPWVDCDKDAANGCEVNPTSGNALNCGACNRTCDAGVCTVGGVCGTSCGDASLCASGCADTTSDPSNCGGCERTCDAGVNQTPSCAAGQCVYTCVEGFAHCNGGQGCEAKLGSVETCGSCKNACDGGPHTGASCADGGCLYGCLTGFTDCNGTLTDGCECAGGAVCPGGPCRADTDCCGGKRCLTAALVPCIGAGCACR